MEQRQRVKTPFDDLTYKIIGCAMLVHRNLGPGQRERIYQRALQDQLTEAGILFEAQRFYEVYDKPDNGRLAQVIGYLAKSGCPIGLLINFGRSSLEYKRIFPPKSVQEHRVNPKWLYVPSWIKEESQR